MTSSKHGFEGRYRLGCGIGIEKVFTHMSHYKKYNQYYNVHLYNSIKKYGYDNFEVIENFDIGYSKEELSMKEQYWISYFGSNSYTKGYNITLGGEGLNSWFKSEKSIIKRRSTIANSMNKKVDSWFNRRRDWKNPFLHIWSYDDGLTKELKEILFHMLANGSVKNCLTCGIYIRKYGKKKCKRCDATPQKKVVHINKLNKKHKQDKTVKTTYKKEKEIEGLKDEIIKMYVANNQSISSIAKKFKINNKNMVDKMKFWGIELRPNNNQHNVDKFIKYNAIYDTQDNLVKVFKFKHETRKWVNDTKVCETGNFSSNQLNRIIKNQEVYNGFKFRIIDEHTYLRHVNKEELNV